MKRIYEDMAYGPGPIEKSYWRSTVDHAGDWERLEGEATGDFAIIGGGYTGLTAALSLAEAGAEVTLLEAETPGWGASGRNGGFCCLGGAKLGAEALARKFGAEDAGRFHDAERVAVEHVAATLDRLGIDADTHSEGETLLAHRAGDVEYLHRFAEQTKAQHGVESTLLAREDLPSAGMASPEFHGALTVPIGFALNPLKYATGLARAAKGAGARILAGSRVTNVEHVDGLWVLSGERGTLRARTLLMATNGYSADDLPDWLAGRYLPVQSNILVTRELTPPELEAQGWTSRQMCYDTRNLLHYFRLMPNNRMLFGLRGAMRSTPAAHAETQAAARADFERIFPAWRHVETPYFWSGLIAAARNLTPFVGRMGTLPNAHAAMCYHGNGVAMGSYAGTLLADLALGRPSGGPFPDLMRAPMGRFPLGRFRRAVLPAACRWYKFKDRG